MISQDYSRFRVLYDYVKDVKPFYNKPNSIIWDPSENRPRWRTPILNRDSVYEVPLNIITPSSMKRYINDKLKRLDENLAGLVYVPFTFFAERLRIGIMVEECNPMDIFIEGNMLPYWLSDFRHIFPQSEGINFC